MRRKANILNPWLVGLVTATGLSAVSAIAHACYLAGQPQWAFVTCFVAAWALFSLLWSNDGYNEQSDLLLAKVMDHNVDKLRSRIEALQAEIDCLNAELERSETGAPGAREHLAGHRTAPRRRPVSPDALV